MQDARITHYSVAWSPVDRIGRIRLHTNAHDPRAFFELQVTAPEMTALVDILRNERPVYFNQASQTLFTNLEMVGEEELD